MARILFGFAVSAAVLLTACGRGDGAQPTAPEPPAEEVAVDDGTDPAPPDPPAEEIPAEPMGELAIVAGDPGEFDFDLQASVPAGRYDFLVTNDGTQFHHAQIYRMEDGVSFEEFQDALLSDVEGGGFPDAARELVDLPPTGVLRHIAPGEEGRARGELEPGVHAVICFLFDISETATPHYALGMLAELEVR